MSEPLPIAVLVSGAGTNLQALLDSVHGREAKVVAVADIPRTKSGKITELAVREVIHNRPVRNIEALANPGALKLYEQLKELAVE